VVYRGGFGSGAGGVRYRLWTLRWTRGHVIGRESVLIRCLARVCEGRRGAGSVQLKTLVHALGTLGALWHVAERCDGAVFLVSYAWGHRGGV
jgi:hypothetical protein